MCDSTHASTILKETIQNSDISTIPMHDLLESNKRINDNSKLKTVKSNIEEANTDNHNLQNCYRTHTNSQKDTIIENAQDLFKNGRKRRLKQRSHSLNKNIDLEEKIAYWNCRSQSQENNASRLCNPTYSLFSYGNNGNNLNGKSKIPSLNENSIRRESSTISPNSFLSPWNTENKNPNRSVVNDIQRVLESKLNVMCDTNVNIQNKLEDKLIQFQTELETIKTKINNNSSGNNENSSSQILDLLVKIKELEDRCKLKKAKRKKSKRNKTLNRYHKKGFKRTCQKWIDYKTYKMLAEKKLIDCKRLKKVSTINIR